MLHSKAILCNIDDNEPEIVNLTTFVRMGFFFAESIHLIGCNTIYGGKGTKPLTHNYTCAIHVHDFSGIKEDKL